MIDDPELRLLFQTESEERLTQLKEGIRQLSSQSGHHLLDALFRDAHTLKGAARMLTLSEVAKVAEAIENVLDQLRKETLKYSPLVAKQLIAMTQQLERLVIEQTIPQKDLKEKEIESVENTSDLASDEIVSVVLGGKKTPLSQTLQNPAIRIAKQQIIDLTRHAADLLVTQNKLTTFVDDIEGILYIIEQSIENLSIEWHGKYPTKWADTLKEIENHLSKLRERTHDDIFKLSSITSLLITEIRSLGLLPFNKIFELFPPTVQETAQAVGKDVKFNIEGGDITVDKKIIEEMKDPIMHILRNAVSHGIESPEKRQAASKPQAGTITLRAQQISQTIIIDINDDGQGLDAEKIKQKALELNLITFDILEKKSLAEIYSLIFLPGFSTADQVTDLSGRGVGLDVVKEHVEKLQGTIQVESQLGQGCRFIIELPISVLTTRVSIVQIYHEIYAIPIEGIKSVCLIAFDDIFQIHNRDVLLYKNQPIPIHFLANILNIPIPANQSFSSLYGQGTKIPCIILNIRGKLLAVIVDAILDEQQVVLVPFKTLLEKTPNLAGVTTLKTGRVCLVVDPVQILKSIQAVNETGSFDRLKESIKGIRTKKKILLVDDSYAIRIYCKKILEDIGYEVLIAENGQEALQLFDKVEIDAMISDIQMPEMDGLELVKEIREKRKNFAFPIILMTALESDDEYKIGIEAGANAYIRKSQFDQKALVELIKKFVS